MPCSAAWWEASFDAAARLGISEREMLAMLPRELYRRDRARAEAERTAWERDITAACIVANRIPQYPQADGTLPPPLLPSNYLPWLREEGAEPDEDLEAIEAAIIARGEALSAHYRAERNAKPNDA